MASAGRECRCLRTELVGDDGHEVGGEAAATGVLADGLLVVGLVDAVHLVAGDVALTQRYGTPRVSTTWLDVAAISASCSWVSSLAPGMLRSMM